MGLSFPSSGSFSPLQGLPKDTEEDLSGCARVCFQLVRWYVYGPDACPLFSFSIAFLVSFLLGFSMLIGRGNSAGGMSGKSSGAGQCNSLEKCSVHVVVVGLWSEASLVCP